MSRRSPLEILEQSRVVAVVGISTDEAKESHRVPAALQLIGFTIIPIHPTATEILDEQAYSTLAAVEPQRGIDVVDIFRPPQEIPELTTQAIAIGAGAVWTQIGLFSTEARAIAADAGIDFVESQCMATMSALHDIDKH